MLNKQTLTLLIASSLLTACGGGGDSSANTEIQPAKITQLNAYSLANADSGAKKSFAYVTRRNARQQASEQQNCEGGGYIQTSGSETPDGSINGSLSFETCQPQISEDIKLNGLISISGTNGGESLLLNFKNFRMWGISNETNEAIDSLINGDLTFDTTEATFIGLLFNMKINDQLTGHHINYKNYKITTDFYNPGNPGTASGIIESSEHGSVQASIDPQTGAYLLTGANSILSVSYDGSTYTLRLDDNADGTFDYESISVSLATNNPEWTAI